MKRTRPWSGLGEEPNATARNPCVNWLLSSLVRYIATLHGRLRGTTASSGTTALSRRAPAGVILAVLEGHPSLTHGRSFCGRSFCESSGLGFLEFGAPVPPPRDHARPVRVLHGGQPPARDVRPSSLLSQLVSPCSCQYARHKYLCRQSHGVTPGKRCKRAGAGTAG